MERRNFKRNYLDSIDTTLYNEATIPNTARNGFLSTDTFRISI